MRTNLPRDESLEAEEMGCGLEGAENMGQEGERGDVGLGDVALGHTRQKSHTEFTLKPSGHTSL